jgi:mRNA interferase MazF
VTPSEEERVVVTYVARTTSVRGTRFEVDHQARGFKPGVFDAQSLGTIPIATLIRKIGDIDEKTLGKVVSAVKAWLNI